MRNFWQEHKRLLKGLIISFAIMALLILFGKQTGNFMASVLDLQKPEPFDGTALPIAEVPDWANLSSGQASLLMAQIPLDKKVPLPNYDPAIFGATVADLNWKSDKTLADQLITYAVPYMGSYKQGSREYEGSHLAIDIKTPAGTPVHAVANGKVVKVAQSSSGFGMHIVIQHPDVPDLNSNETTTLYSAYAHLSKTIVTTGQIVKRGDIIGESGSSGTSTTPHLHFQIDRDTAPWHPWWPFTSADTTAAGVSFFDGVSAGIGQAEAIKNTINPMLWVQRYLVTGNQTYNSDLHASDSTATINDTTTETQAETTATDSETATEPVSTQTVADTSSTTPSPEQSSEVVEPTVSDQATNDQSPTESIFTDVDSTNKYTKAIKYLKENAIVGGYPDGTFQPDKTVSRVEALKMILLGLGIATEEGKLNFPDTGKNEWYAPFVETAVARQIAAGYPDGTFGPAKTVNRAEYLKILLFAAGIAPDSVTENPYADVPADAWFSSFAAYSKTKNIFPLEGNLFEGVAGVTRGEVAETLYRLIVLQKTGADSYSADLEI
ncbi:MAG: S-layer homology domain-containing protein [Patescibacteria group bacterium]